MSRLTDKILEEIWKHPTVPEPYGDMLDVLYSEMKAGDKSAHDRNKAFRNEIARGLRGCSDYKKQGVFNSQYKKSLLMDAQVDLDAYIQYLEYERDPDKRFYLPRRDVLRPLVQDLQDLYDGEIDFLGVSMPPRVGKALAFDTPVLTRQGWKKHGSLSLMDEVIAPDGSFVKVLAIHPACEMKYEVSFTNGEKVICHGNHEWMIVNPWTNEDELLETYVLVNYLEKCKCPIRIPDKYLGMCGQNVRIDGICRVSGEQGNCITVEGGMYCVGRQLIPTHNSTMCIMFVTWLMGNRPDVASVMSGHSDKLTDGFYRELLSILTDSTTYAWGDVFPTVKLVDTSAKNETIDLNHSKRFPTMTCRSIGGTLTGAVEIGSGGLLYVDDLIEDLEESLNPLRLQAKYDAYLNQLKDRKKMGALELMVGTRWNVYDPLGRVHDQYQDDPRYRFRVIPALNEDGESNFNYKYGLGFDTRYYQDMKASIDDATWNAKYMGSPYIREGLLFPEDELRYYNGVLPDGEPDKVAVCDVAWGGGDSLAMPFAYVYGENVYIPDVIFNRGDKTVTYPIVIGRCMQHLPNTVRMESNNGGSEYCDKVDEELRKLGVRLNMYSIRTPSTRNKVTRITQYAPDIKKFYFLADKYQTREYRAFMKEVTMFVQTGKNLHDDAPDSLAMLAEELFHRTAKIEFVKRPF